MFKGRILREEVVGNKIPIFGLPLNSPRILAQETTAAVQSTVTNPSGAANVTLYYGQIYSTGIPPMACDAFITANKAVYGVGAKRLYGRFWVLYLA